jgi:FOG: WD40 repeat
VATGNKIWILDNVFSVAFSPDGKCVLTGGADSNMAELRDVGTGAVIKTFNQAQKSNNQVIVAFGSDGKYILTGSSDKKAMVWDVETGNKIQEFNSGADIYSVALSPDGKYALTASADKAVMLWNVKMGNKMHTFHYSHNGYRSVAFSPDGKDVLIASEGKALLFDVSCLNKLEKDLQPVRVNQYLLLQALGDILEEYNSTKKPIKIKLDANQEQAFDGLSDDIRKALEKFVIRPAGLTEQEQQNIETENMRNARIKRFGQFDKNQKK